MTVKEKIANLDGESSVKDFREIIDEQQDDIYSLNEKYQDILEKNIKPMGGGNDRVKDEQLTKMFLSVLGKNRDEMDKLGFIACSDKAFEEGTKTDITFRGSEKAGLGTVLRGDSTGALGSYLVPEAWLNEVLRTAQQSSVMMGKVRKVDMTARTVKIPAVATDLEFTLVTDETTAKTESAPTFDQVDLECETFAAWLGCTDELLEDSVINLGALFSDLFGESWGTQFDYQVLRANSGGSDVFDGMLFDSSVNALSMGAGDTSFADVTWEDLIDLQDQLSTETAHFGAVYIMSRYVFNILRKLKDDNGNPIFQPSLAIGEPSTLLGKSYILSDQMPGASDDAVSTAFLIYGNPKYWLHGNRVGMQVKVYDQTSYNLQHDQVFFRARLRAAFKAGQPANFARLVTAAE